MKFSEELKTAAIVGTAQNELNFSVPDGKLGAALSKLDRTDREKFLLSAAAVFTVWQAAGKSLAVDKENLPEPAESETKEILSGRLRQIFETLLGDSNESLLPEFLDLMRRRGKIIPPELLPLSFDSANQPFQKPDFRQQILSVAGERGKWLANQNADWRWVLVEENAEEVFATGKTAERTFALEFIRKTDAGKALEILQKTWKTEATRERQKFLEILEINLNSADEDFLENVLQTDKSGEVRQTAFDMLARLKNSKLVSEITSQILKILKIEKISLKKSKLEIDFPADFEKQFLFNKSGKELGYKGWKLSQMLGAVSLGKLENHFGLPPADFINLAKTSSWAPEFFLGFARAILRQKNLEWFEALLMSDSETEIRKAFEGKHQSFNQFTGTLQQTVYIVPAEKIEKLVFPLLEEKSLHDGNTALNLLSNFQHFWSDDLSRLFINSIKDSFSVKTKRKKSEPIWILQNFLPCAAEKISFKFGAKNLFETDEEILPEAVKNVREFEEILRLRNEINTIFENEE